jgi:hypothetical protein
MGGKTMSKLKKTSIKTQVTGGKRNYIWFLYKTQNTCEENSHRIFTRRILA